jgi:hypothetical protein
MIPGNRLVFRLSDFKRLQFLKGGESLEFEVEHRCDIDKPRLMKVRFRRVGNEIEQSDPTDR